MMTPKEKQRMERLLAMSRDSSSENEAMIAARRLHSMLTKYSMSIEDLNDGTNDHDAVGESRDENVINFPWIRTVAHGLAKFYYCKMYYITGNRKNYISLCIVGTDQNREITLQMTKLLVKMINKAASKYCKERTGKTTGTVASAFKTAAARRILRRCNEMIEESKRGNLRDEETGENLPATMDLYERNQTNVDDWLNSNVAGMTTRTSTPKARDPLAEQAGRNAADKMPIGQQIGKAGQKLLA